ARFELTYSTADAVKDAAQEVADQALLAQTGRAIRLLTNKIAEAEENAQDALGLLAQLGVAVGGHGPAEPASSQYQDCPARYTISAPVINLRSAPEVEWTGPSAIYLQALGDEEEGGDVLVFGSDSVFVAGGSMGSVNVETNEEEQGIITL